MNISELTLFKDLDSLIKRDNKEYESQSYFRLIFFHENREWRNEGSGVSCEIICYVFWSLFIDFNVFLQKLFIGFFIDNLITPCTSVNGITKRSK